MSTFYGGEMEAVPIFSKQLKEHLNIHESRRIHGVTCAIPA
jgi:hypothetical protein